MIRLYLSVFFALFVLVVPKESIGQNGGLAELNEIRIIVEDLSSQAKRLGITRQVIKDHALVLLRSKLPRLSVKDSAIPYVYINVGLGIGKYGAKELDYYGAVMVKVKRGVTINKTGGRFIGSVWDASFRLTGPRDAAVDDHVRRVVDKLLTEFAADWYRDNPAK